jgi:hypothetical protein
MKASYMIDRRIILHDTYLLRKERNRGHSTMLFVQTLLRKSSFIGLIKGYEGKSWVGGRGLGSFLNLALGDFFLLKLFSPVSSRLKFSETGIRLEAASFPSSPSIHHVRMDRIDDKITLPDI